MAPAPQTPAWQTALVGSWTRRGALAWLLWPISLLFRTLVACRRGFYRLGWFKAQRLPVPVLVVGNVVAGGAGKTPVVMALVEHLQRRGITVGVVSRGYGRRSVACLEVTQDRLAHEVGDEPALIHRRTQAPVFVARSRVQAAQALLAKHPQTQIIISDDGLQHLALARDVELAVFDDRGVGNGWLLPAGPLREPWPRPIDLILHTGQRPAFAGCVAARQLAHHAVRADGSRITLNDLARDTKPLLALAAIAQPEAFFAMLRAHGLTLARTMALPDHDDVSRFHFGEFPDYTVICTEKDAVKLWLLAPTAWAVPLQCTLPPEFLTTLDAQLERVLPPSPPPQTLSSRHGHTTT